MAGFNRSGVDQNILEKWKPSAANHQVTLWNDDTGISLAVLQEQPFSPF